MGAGVKQLHLACSREKFFSDMVINRFGENILSDEIVDVMFCKFFNFFLES